MRDNYLTNWYKWGRNKVGPKPDVDPQYAPSGLTNEQYEEQLLSGKILLDRYQNLILRIVKYPPCEKPDLWDDISRSIVNEPRKKDPIKYDEQGKGSAQDKKPIPEKPPILGWNERYVIMVDFYAGLRLEFFEAVLRFDPSRAAFSTYIKAELNKASVRIINPIKPYRTLKYDPEQPSSPESPDRSSTNVKEAMALIKSVLTDRQWQVFRLAMYDNVPDTYAGQILDVSQPAVTKTVTAIRHKLWAEPVRSKLCELLVPPGEELQPMPTRKKTKRK